MLNLRVDGVLHKRL
jgi:hypothetical protein